MSGLDNIVLIVLAIAGGYAVRTRDWGYAAAFVGAVIYVLVKAYS